MRINLESRVALVCGASKGIGYATAEALALSGAKVMMIARNREALEQAASDITSQGGSVLPHVGDVGDVRLASDAVNKCNQLLGCVDILVNNSGGPPMGGMQEHDEMVWNNAVQNNLLSVVRFCKAVAPGMKERGWGRIISVTSTVAKEPSPSMVLSATTRAGVSALTKALAIELAPNNITVNAICPGGVLTERLISLLHSRAEREGRDYLDVLAESQKLIPANRFADPKEIASVITFLASDQGGYINGVSLSVDGALTKAYN